LGHCRLAELVENGPHPPPGKTGAKFIIREDGHRLDLRYLKKSSDRHLELGYKVNFLAVPLSLVPALSSFHTGILLRSSNPDRSACLCKQKQPRWWNSEVLRLWLDGLLFTIYYQNSNTDPKVYVLIFHFQF
jgi:hypothetical protein